MQTFVLLDRSGSMQANWVETLGAVNTYVESQANTDSLKGDKVTLTVFDSGTPMVEVLRSSVRNTDWVPVTSKDASPRAMTPLFDAIRALEEQVNSAKADKISIVIITDGHENASKGTTKEQAGKMIDGFKAKGYDVVFIGADFDAFGQGASVGVSSDSTMTMNKGSYGAAMTRMTMRNAAYATGVSGQSLQFSDEDRAFASGNA